MYLREILNGFYKKIQFARFLTAILNSLLTDDYNDYNDFYFTEPFNGYLPYSARDLNSDHKEIHFAQGFNDYF